MRETYDFPQPEMKNKHSMTKKALTKSSFGKDICEQS